MSGTQQTLTGTQQTLTGGRLDAFALRDEVVREYRSYVEGFIHIADDRVRGVVDEALSSERLWPDPWVQSNPKFSPGASVADLVADGRRHFLQPRPKAQASGCVVNVAAKAIQSEPENQRHGSEREV